MPDKHRDYTEQRQEENNHERNKTIARNPPLVTQRAQPLNPTCGQVAYQFRVRRGRAPKMTPNPPNQRGKIILSDAQFVVMLWSGGNLNTRTILNAFNMHFLKDRFLNGPGSCGWGLFSLRMVNRHPVWYRGRTQFRVSPSIPFNTGIKLLDFALELGDLVAQRRFPR